MEFIRQHFGQMVSPFPCLCAFVVISFSLLATNKSGHADEPYAQFLQKLKEEGLFDLAVAYLDDLDANPRTGRGIKADLELERGLLQYQAAAYLPPSDERRANKLDGAEAAVRQFLQNNKNHPRRGEARLKLGEMLLSRAEEAKKDGDPSSDNEEAIKYFDSSHQLFEATISELASILERIKGARTDPNDKAKVAYRQKVQQDLRQAQLLSAKSVEERGRSRAEDSPAQRADLEQSLKMFSDLYSKEQRMVGVRNYALFYRSQIQVTLGRVDDAIDGFQRIADLTSIDVLRPLQSTSIKELLSLLGEKGKYSVAIERADNWISELRPDERASLETIELKVQLAKTRLAWAKALRKKDPNDRVASRLTKATRDELRSLLRVPGAHLEETRALLAELGVEPTVAEVADDELPEVKDFAEALAAAQERIDQAEEKALDLELQSQGGDAALAELEAAIDLKRDQAIELIRIGLRLYSKDDSREQLVDAQFRLAYLLFKRQEPWGALTIAELLSRQNQGTDEGRRAASIALNAYSDILRMSGDSVKGELTDHLEGFSGYLMIQWPESAEASAAASAVVQLSLLNDDFEKAESFLEQLPASGKTVAKLKRELGLKLYEAYKTTKGDDEADRQQVEQVKGKALAALEEGCEQLASGTLDNRSIEAVNALASLYTYSGRNDDASKLLLKSERSPFKAIQANADVATPRTAMNSYRVAIRIVINQLTDGKLESSVATGKVQSYVKELQSLATSVDQGDKILASMFVGLARDVKTQRDEIADPQKRRRLSDALVLVAAEAGKSDSFNAQYWAGDTLLSTAEDLSVDRAGKAVATRAYAAAEQILRSILEREKTAPGWIAPASFKTQVRLQQAKAKRGLGNYKGAIEELAAMLTENSGLLTVQIEAARTYQAWGDAVNSGFHRLAFLGGRPDPKTKQKLIWGWGKLAQKVTGNDEFETQFYEARYELARSRFKYASGLKNDERKKAETAQAEKDITSTASLYPKLGGPDMKKKYDTLLRQIQRSLGKPAQGLAGRS